jgi:dihydrofolate synthase/folylpolyglutamate synthase
VSYADVLARLVGARRFGVVLGLDRMRALLDRLGAPDRRLGTVIHVGGTNGKGSTVAMIAALARSAGQRVATYTSPHLSTLRERIEIEGKLASEAAIVDAAARVSAAGGDELTFFEQVTAIAMLIIADARVDVSVLEVGLGGRLDATNVVDARVAVVTGVALDHEAILGTTIDAIAREKAGIFKRGQHAVIGASGDPAAVPLLAELARTAGVASLRIVDEQSIASVPPIALRGAHQRHNAAAALRAIAAAGLGPDQSAFAHADPSALARVVYPGRFERADTATGELILDGAHNPHGAAALAATLAELQLRPVLVVAIAADKDARAIIAALAPQVAAIVATRFGQERSLEPAALAAICKTVTELRVDTAPDVVAAIEHARTLGSPVLVAGSLFVVGEARAKLLGAPADPIAVSDPAAKPT